MTLLADQIERIQWILQDTDSTPARQAQVAEQHQEALQGLARRDAFTSILWVQAIPSQAIYAVPDAVLDIAYVFYNQQVLRYATEKALDRRTPGWEGVQDKDPTYWTIDNLQRNTFRVIPAPLRPGSGVPVVPSPLTMPMVDNFVVFVTQDVSATVSTPGNTLPTLLDWDDWLVWDTARALAERETPQQNLPVAQLLRQLSGIWTQLLRMT